MRVSAAAVGGLFCGLMLEGLYRLLVREPQWVAMRDTPSYAWPANASWTGGGDVV